MALCLIMKNKKITEQDFIHFSRCKTLFHHAKNRDFSLKEDPELSSLIESFCRSFEDITIIKNRPSVTKKISLIFRKI